jgi:hypothetical protein
VVFDVCVYVLVTSVRLVSYSSDVIVICFDNVGLIACM